MKKLLSILSAVMLVLSLCACGEGADSEPVTDAGLQVGFGREKIMPDGVVDLGGGDSSARQSSGFLDYLYVTCVAVKDEAGETVLLYTMDLIGSEVSFTKPVRTLISGATGVSEDHIMIAATHTHSSVSIRSKWDGVDAYKEIYNAAMVKAGEDAIADLSAAEVYIGSTQAEGMAFVRHYLLKDGTVTSSGVGRGSDKIAGHAAENDEQLQMIRFVRADEAKKDIILMSFNVHPTFNEGGLMISADFPGPTRDYIESKGDYLVAYFTGDAGNQAPETKIIEEDHGLDYKEYGQKLGQLVIDALPGLVKTEGSAVKISGQQYVAAANKEKLDMLVQAAEVVALNKTAGRDAANALAAQYGLYQYLEANAIVTRANSADTKDVWLNVMSIGDQLSFAFAPYEMFSEHGSYIRSSTPYDMTFLVTCCNGAEGYLPSAAAFEYGCYEGYVTRLARGTGEDLADTFLDMLTKMKEGVAEEASA